MGFFKDLGRSVEKETSRASHSFEKNITRKYGREFERIPVLGYVTRQLQEQTVAKREALRDQKSLQSKQRLAQESEELRQATTTAFLAAQESRNRRIQMAESLVGSEVGLYGTTPIDGPNLTVNNIPLLDPMDDMGNSIPEVT
jgi:hypothetical protein